MKIIMMILLALPFLSGCMSPRAGDDRLVKFTAPGVEADKITISVSGRITKTRIEAKNLKRTETEVTADYLLMTHGNPWVDAIIEFEGYRRKIKD